MNDGEAMANIGKSLNLHIKTIYQIRLTLTKSSAARVGQIFLILAAAKRSKPGPSSISDNLPASACCHASGRQAAE